MTSPGRAIGFLGLMISVLVAARFGCAELGQRETVVIVQKSRNETLKAAAGLEPAVLAQLRLGLDQALDLAHQGKLSPIARDTLRNRSEACLADGTVTALEAQHLLQLLADIPQWHDEVHARKYMGQR